MSIHRALDPLPSNMSIELGQVGHIKRLENSFKNAKFEQEDLLVMYDNELVTELAVKGNSQQVYNLYQPKPCKCGRRQPHNKRSLFILCIVQNIVYLIWLV